MATLTSTKSRTSAVECIARRRRGAAPDHGERGVALILVLVFIVLLTVLVVEFSYETQVEASFALNQVSDFNLKIAARSAVAQGMSLLNEDLLADEVNGFSVDSWFDEVPWPEGQPFQPLNDVEMRTAISDEYGKINLNALVYLEGDAQADRGWLSEVLLLFLDARAEAGSFDADGKVITESILDWVDYGDDDEVRDDGAEDDFYQNSEIPIACRNGPMDSIEELLLIRGMTPEFYYGNPDLDPPQLPLSEYLTVHGDWHGRININTAPEDVLGALAEHFGGGFDCGREIYYYVREDQAMQDVPGIESTHGHCFPNLQTAQSNRNNRNNRNNENGEDLDGDGQPDPDTSGGGTGGGTGFGDIFTTASAVFRILGDAMEENSVARVEAYVLRNPLAYPEVLVGATPDQQARVAALQIEAPVEQFRILDWKFIQ